MYRTIKQQLMDSGMDGGEARAVALLLMEKICGMDTAAALMAPADWGKDNADEACRLHKALGRILKGEPVQYALGEADFCGLTLHVEKGVLIPRAETEELVRWVAESGADDVLDIGTGSGCIAVSLAGMLPQAKVEAWDVSDEALAIAEGNAKRVGVNVSFLHVDVLKEGMEKAGERKGKYDAIVSNPPYICEDEAVDMEANVLDHEPHLALFVSNDDPLLFYRRIAMMARTMLRGGGSLFFEINRRFGAATVGMLKDMGYHDVQLKQDLYGNDRMVKAVR